MHLHRFASTLIVLGACGFGLACSSSNDDVTDPSAAVAKDAGQPAVPLAKDSGQPAPLANDAGEPSVPVANDASSFIAQRCAMFMPCCAKAGRSTDPRQCERVQTFMANGTYDPVNGAKCLAELRAASTAFGFCNADLTGDSTPSCAKVSAAATGTVTPGGECKHDGECAPSSEGRVVCASAFSDGPTKHACQVRLDGKLGDACVGTVGALATYPAPGKLPSELPPRTHLCHARDGLRCDGATCVAAARIGETCAPMDPAACVEGAFCDAMLRTCVDGSKIVRREEGASCTTNAGCASENCLLGKCAPWGTYDLDVRTLCIE